MKILLVNTVAQGGSIPSYMRAIADKAAELGHTVAVAKGRRGDMTGVMNISIGTRFDTVIHGIATRLFDRHGLSGRRATLAFIREIEAFAPDIIHLHNIHGYYLHYPTLFSWLATCGIPVLWSLHDSWAYTGHCASPVGSTVCTKWQTHCSACPCLKNYPASFYDRSARNFDDKRRWFTSVPTLRLLPVSDWLSSQLAQSFLSGVPRTTVKLDIDTSLYRPVAPPKAGRVLGVANMWNGLKGLDFFRLLRQQLPSGIEIRLIGNIRQRLPHGITSIGPVYSKEELIKEYSEATVFVNPTRADSLCLTNREALSCGTPVISRDIFGTFEDIAPGSPVMLGARTDSGLAPLVTDFLKTTAPGELRAQCRDTALALYGSSPGMRKLFSVYDSLA